MAERKATRLSKAARELNVGITTIIEFLGKKGHEIDSNPNSKVDPELYDLLLEEYSSDLSVKKESEKLTLKNLRERQESLTLEDDPESTDQEETEELLITDKTSGTPVTVVQEVKEQVPVAEEEEKVKADKQPQPQDLSPKAKNELSQKAKNDDGNDKEE